MTLRVLLTGATGFIGREAARGLSRRGHALSLFVRGKDARARAAREDIPGRACPGDLEDSDAVRDAVAGAEVVVHLVALVDPALQADAHAVFRVNRDLAVELARTARSAGAQRFVFMSSIAAMGFWSGSATAESACRPETPYGRAKREAELAVLDLAHPGFDVVVLRPPTVYGPGEAYNFLAWVRAVDRGLFRVIGRGKNRFPLATTDNVVRATCAAVSGALGTGVYLVADREPYTMNRIHRAILEALGKGGPRLHVPVSAARLSAFANERLHGISSQVPLVLTSARVRTLTVDQRFDVQPLLENGVDLDAPLEAWVALTIRDYERRGLLHGR